ncbi:MAG TPA: hypothetical protein DCE41_35875, partial [Cytophagales bacterium]|nr:hypothetical protein [Cytophagales bacterium]
MRRAIQVGLVLSFLVICSPVSAQVDSLIQALATVSAEEKPGLLNDITWKLRNVDANRAIQYGLRAVEAAENQ